MTNEAAYEAALLAVWEHLGKICPADFKDDDGEVETSVERAYYAAENALFHAGLLSVTGEGLRRVPGTGPQEGAE
jgi:hypothetical protein